MSNKALAGSYSCVSEADSPLVVNMTFVTTGFLVESASSGEISYIDPGSKENINVKFVCNDSQNLNKILCEPIETNELVQQIVFHKPMGPYFVLNDKAYRFLCDDF